MDDLENLILFAGKDFTAANCVAWAGMMGKSNLI
jgi:hypothetical protein